MFKLSDKWKKVAELKYADDIGIDISLLSDKQKKEAYEEVEAYSIFLSDEKLKELFDYE